MTKPTSRLAPSPTGALHLGNARTFLINWAMARRNDWSLPMRIEDLDGPRNKPDAARDALDTLAWLGIDWDGEVTYQSHDLSPYQSALRRHCDDQSAYACELTRSEIAHAASAPHGDDPHELRVPETVRPAEPERYRFDREDTNYRFVVPDKEVTIDDQFMGTQVSSPFREVGDFAVWTKRGGPSYQLAVTVDDARQGVTDVVRGSDLLPSAARQTLLYEALGHVPPRWWHLPLVLGPDGRRLAKRHGDTRVAYYREQGIRRERIVGLLAWWSGFVDQREELNAADFRDRFAIDTLSRDPVTFTEEDDAWLRGAR